MTDGEGRFASSQDRQMTTCPSARSYSFLTGIRSLPFRAFKVQKDGGLHFIKAVETFDDAKECVQALSVLWPGKYVIDNVERDIGCSLARRRRGRTKRCG